MTLKHSWIQLLLVSSILILSNTPARAQITPDDTLGAEGSRLTPNVQINGTAADRIEGGAARGANLFHSFQEFNVNDGQRLYFANPTGIQNILTRVTGANVSNILGTLGVDGSANLFLLNPNGIIFGPNARLDVRGSFVGTTANAIGFGEQGSFNATNPEAPPLLTVNPSALLFNQLSAQSPPAIENRGFLRVPNSQSLLLVGGDVRLDQGIVAALGGRVKLGGLAGTGSIELDFDRGGLQLRPPEAGERADVSLANRSIVDVSSGGGGDVAIYARNLDVLAGSRIYAGIDGGLGSVNSQAGDITLNATDTIQVGASSFIGNDVNLNETGNAGNLRITSGSLFLTNGAQLSASTFGVGAAGDLTIQTGSLQVLNSAQVRASTFGAGKGGNLNITANRVELSNGFLSVQARKDATGNAGNLSIQTGTLLVQDGGQVSAGTSGAGNGGNLTVNASAKAELIGTAANGLPSGLFTEQVTPEATGTARNLTIDTPVLLVKDGAFISASTYGAGVAGDLTIKTGSLQVLNGSQVISGTLGAGNGGFLTVNASEKVEVSGIAANGQVSGLSTQQNIKDAIGTAGDLTIDTPVLLVKDGAQVSASTYGVGAAGNLTIRTGNLQVLNEAEVGANTYGAGKGGNLMIAANTVELFNGLLSAQARGDVTGNAGNLSIQTGSLLVQDGAQVSAGTFGAGNGGSLTVNASEGVQLIGRSADAVSGLFTTAQSNATGTAGDLTINTPQLLVRDGAQVSAGTFGPGDGGSLTVNASEKVQLIGISNGRYPSGLFTTAESAISGKAGDLTIDTPVLLVQDGAQVSASTYGAGAAGNLTIRTGTLQVLNKAQVGANTSGAGKGGNLTVTAQNVQLANGFLRTQANQNATSDAGDLAIQTGTLLVQDGGEVSAGTFGAGKSGNLTVNASEKVEVIGSAANGQRSSLITETVSRAKEATAGNLSIDTPMLLVSDGAVVSASTFGAGDGGNLTINASEKVEVTGTTVDGQVGSRLAANTGGTGKAGNLTINTKRLVVNNGQVSATTFGKGDAGNLTVNASESIELSGVYFGANDDYPAGLFAQVNSQGEGRGGNLRVETGRLSISNGAKVQVATYGTGNAGELFIRASDIDIFETPKPKSTYFAGGIYAGVQTTREATKPPKGYGGSVTIETNRLRVRDGGTVTTTTEGQGDAGTLRIRANESIEVFGISPDGQFQSEISAAVTPESTGNAGSLSIDTGKLTIRDRGIVTVRNERKDGTSQAGNLTINARSLNLNKGTLTATTNSGNGGDMILEVQDFLLLRNNSTISTTAGNAQQGGDGGNITINSPFIFAVPKEDSDITANAYSGRGGNVRISTQGLFGIATRQQLTSESDITASSQLGVQGQLDITEPNVQPTQGVVELPGQVVDASNQIAQSCPRGTASRPLGEFIITGRGSLPPNPIEPLAGTPNISSLATIDSSNKLAQSSPIPEATTSDSPTAIVEAQGWITDSNGTVVLVAYTPEVKPSTRPVATACPVSKQQ